jgi:hypothetical protein
MTIDANAASLEQLLAPQQPQQNAAPDIPNAAPNVPAPGGGATLGEILLSKGWQPPAPQVPFQQKPVHEKLASIADILLHRRQPTPGPVAAPQQTQAAPQGPQGPQPQSTGQRIAGAVEGIGASLGDAAIGKVPEGAGALYGVTKALQNRSERLSREAAAKIQLGEANAHMLNEQRLTHKINEEAILGSITNGTQMVEKMKGAASPAPVLAEDKTGDELGQMMQEGKLDQTKHTQFPTGRRQVGEENGSPLYATTYTVLGVPPDVTLDPNVPADKVILDRLNKYAPPGEGMKWGGGAKGTSGIQPLTGAQFNLISQNASTNEAAERARQQVLDDNEIADSKRGAAIEAIHSKPEIINALAHNGNDPFKALNALQQTGKYPNVQQDMENYYGKDEWKLLNEKHQKEIGEQTGIVSEIAKDPTKIEGKTSSVMAAASAIFNDPNSSPSQKADAQKVYKQAQDTRALEVQLEGAKELQKNQIKKDAASRSNPSGLTGEAFIKTLPPGRAASLKAINDGSVAINPSALERSDKGQAFMDDIYAAYPDFQAYKGETWPKAFNEYMGSGATAKAKINYNTALSHLKDLYVNSTAEGLYNPTSKAFQDRKAAFDVVVNEVGKAVKSGVITQGEGEELKSSLNGWFPSTAKERAAHVGFLLKNKIDEFQTAFQDAAPSAQIKTPTLISPQAQAAYDFVQQAQNPQPQAQQQQAAPVQQQPTQQQPVVQSIRHQVGDSIVQNGRTFKVTSVDASGKVTGAQ